MTCEVSSAILKNAVCFKSIFYQQLKDMTENMCNMLKACYH